MHIQGTSVVLLLATTIGVAAGQTTAGQAADAVRPQCDNVAAPLALEDPEPLLTW